MSKLFRSIDAPRALRAARALLADPEDLPQVFTLIESLSGNTMTRLAHKMKRHDGGRRLLETTPSILDKLDDREALRRLPEGSLGRAYLAFVESEGISSEGIRDAAMRGERGTRHLPADEAFISNRLRDTHDLWHAAIGYRGDVLGETALLAFSLTQTWNPGIAIILAIGFFKTAHIPAARSVIWEGFRRGLRSAWLPGEDWDNLLAEPVETLRGRLSLGAPPVYTPVRPAELRAMASARA